jgi:hypothetical protein
MTEATTATSGATPGEGATPGAESDPQDPSTVSSGDGLDDGGKKALSELRRELRKQAQSHEDKDRRIAELEDAQRSDSERRDVELGRLRDENSTLRATNEKHERDEARRRAATQAGIPDLWDRLIGDDDEALAADAKTMAERLGASPAPPRDLGAGARPGGTVTGTSGMDRRIRDRARR